MHIESTLSLPPSSQTGPHKRTKHYWARRPTGPGSRWGGGGGGECSGDRAWRVLSWPMGWGRGAFFGGGGDEASLMPSNPCQVSWLVGFTLVFSSSCQ
jgi:hypothetical protein